MTQAKATQRLLEVAATDTNIETDAAIAQEIRSLLVAGADVNGTNNQGETALHLAIRNGRTEVVRLLLENHADRNARSVGGWTALMEAAQAEEGEAVLLLLKSGADPGVWDYEGKTARDIAMQCGNKAIGELLAALTDG